MDKQKIYSIIEGTELTANKASRTYDHIMYLAIILGLIPLMFRTNTPILLLLDYISCACFITDYVLRWITYDIHLSRKGKDYGFWNYLIYPITPMAIIDLISILPTFTPLNCSFKIVRTLRLLKILRILKATRKFKALIQLANVIKKQRAVLLTVFSLSIVYIFITALIMYNTDEGIDNQRNFENFFDAFYWATCTLTTVGYGDIYPITDIGRIISMLSSLVGVAIVALPSGVITAGYMEELKECEKEEKDPSDSPEQK